MTILYEGYTICGTPEEIRDFIRLVTPVNVSGVNLNDYLKGLGMEPSPGSTEFDDIRNADTNNGVCVSVKPDQWTLFYHGKSIYDLNEDELREAMAYERLDKLCDIETMTREEMIKFLDAYYQTRR